MSRSYRHQTLIDLLDKGGFAFDIYSVQELDASTYKVVWTRGEPKTFAAWAANNLEYFDFEVDHTRPLFETLTIIKEKGLPPATGIRISDPTFRSFTGVFVIIIGTVVFPPTQDSLGKTRLFVESSIGFLNVIVPNHGVVNTPETT